MLKSLRVQRKVLLGSFCILSEKFKCRSTDTEEKENFNYVTYPKIVKSNGTYR